MLMPMVLGLIIIGFALYSCCGPAANPEQEKPHSYRSSMLDVHEQATDCLTTSPPHHCVFARRLS